MSRDARETPSQHAGYISTGIVEGVNPQFESTRSSELKLLKKPMFLLSTMRFLHKNHPLVKYFFVVGVFSQASWPSKKLKARGDGMRMLKLVMHLSAWRIIPVDVSG